MQTHQKCITAHSPPIYLLDSRTISLNLFYCTCEHKNNLWSHFFKTLPQAAHYQTTKNGGEWQKHHPLT